MSTRLIMPISKETTTLRTARTLLHVDPKKVRKACRMLFGKPDKNELMFVECELKQMQKLASEKYNFDFDKGVPIHSPNGNYVYTSCEIVRAPIKKKKRDLERLDELESAEADLAYFKPEELDFNRLRDDCNLNDESNGTEKEPLNNKEKRQTCITDFMPQRKRNIATMDKEKSDATSALVPQKLMKLEVKS